MSPDGSFVVSGREDGALEVWDAASGKPRCSLRHGYAVLLAVFSPDGTRVLTASRDNTARVWDATSGAPLDRHANADTLDCRPAPAQ